MKLPNIFSDGAIFQREKPIAVWGESDPCTVVAATLNGVSGRGVTGLDGKFQLRLPPLPAGGPYKLQIRNRDTGDECVLRDIWVGEVWLASGQSNMEFRLKESPLQYRAFQEENLASGRIRCFRVVRRAAGAQESFCNGCWLPATTENAAEFSAVALWFAKKLEESLDIPVGIMDSSFGGTDIQAWTSRQSLMSDPVYAEEQRVYEEGIRQEKPWAAASCENLKAGTCDQITQYEGVCTPDPGNAGYQANWASVDFDDSQWREFSLPGNWTREGLSGNGVVWVRREVELPPEWEGQALILHTAGIDKTDITYFNGAEIGASGSGFCDTLWNVPRMYRIPGRLVKAGRNVIAIRAYSFICDGQFLAPAAAYYLECASTGERIGFSGRCRFECETDFHYYWNPLQLPGPLNPNTPAILFDGMIRPLIPYTLRGVIWYQGENNTRSIEEAREYEKRLHLLIKDWRFHWGQGDFPFYLIQLANYREKALYDENSTWAPLRESQRRVARDERNCGQVSTIDCGEAEDIHPKDKRTVGTRLAHLVLRDIFGFDIPAGGPTVKAVRNLCGELRVEFNDCEDGLILCNGEFPLGFHVASGNGEYCAAKAEVAGNCVLLRSYEVKDPISVRYGWADNPEINLMNGSGLPAAPFEVSVE